MAGLNDRVALVMSGIGARGLTKVAGLL